VTVLWILAGAALVGLSLAAAMVISSIVVDRINDRVIAHGRLRDQLEGRDQ